MRNDPMGTVILLTSCIPNPIPHIRVSFAVLPLVPLGARRRRLELPVRGPHRVRGEEVQDRDAAPVRRLCSRGRRQVRSKSDDKLINDKEY